MGVSTSMDLTSSSPPRLGTIASTQPNLFRSD